MIKFLGHVISSDGIRADPDKTRAIVNFPTPDNRRKLRRLFGIVNYLRKFSSCIAANTVALHQLLEKDCDWHWSDQHDNEFRKPKDIMSATPTLSPFVLGLDTMINADASSYALGATIMLQEPLLLLRSDTTILKRRRWQ